MKNGINIAINNGDQIQNKKVGSTDIENMKLFLDQDKSVKYSSSENNYQMKLEEISSLRNKVNANTSNLENLDKDIFLKKKNAEK